jgi:hypothetical protein
MRKNSLYSIHMSQALSFVNFSDYGFNLIIFLVLNIKPLCGNLCMVHFFLSLWGASCCVIYIYYMNI